MADCPFFIHALLVGKKNDDEVFDVNDRERINLGTECIKSRCQMWDKSINDCGLKLDVKEIFHQADITNQIRASKKLNQDPWSDPE